MEAPGLQNLGWMLGSIPRRRAYDLRLRYRRYGTLLIRTAHPASKSLVGIVGNSRVHKSFNCTYSSSGRATPL